MFLKIVFEYIIKFMYLMIVINKSRYSRCIVYKNGYIKIVVKH